MAPIVKGRFQTCRTDSLSRRRWNHCRSSLRSLRLICDALHMRPMHAVTQDAPAPAIQAGYRAIAVEPEAGASALRLCLVLKDSPDPVGGLLITLGDVAD